MSHTDIANGLFAPKNQPRLQDEHELTQKVLGWEGLGLWSLDAPTRQLHLSDTGFFARLGFAGDTSTTISLDDWQKLVHPEDEFIPGHILQAIREGRESAYENRYRVRTVTGEYITLHILGRVTAQDSEGKPLQLSGIAQDVTQIVQAEKESQQRDRLIAVSNEAARLLLHTTVQDFNVTIWKVLHLLGTAAQVDCVYVWRDYIGPNGRPYATMVHEWLHEGTSQNAKRVAADIDYDTRMPGWYTLLCEGQPIGTHVRLLPPHQQEVFIAQGVLSFLISPIQHNGKPWGIIAFDACQSERTWTNAEEGVLKAVGMLIATAVNRHEIEAILDAERVMFKQMFDTSPVSLSITTNGIVQRCNRHCVETLGVDVGQSAHLSYVSPTFRSEILEEVCRKGRIVGRNVQFRGRDGKGRDALATYQPIVYDGKPSILCWAVDISDLKKTEKALMFAKEAAEKAMQAKSEFLSRMSHELRTPLNAITGMVYLCNQTELTEKQKMYLEEALTASNHLLGLVESILDFATIDAKTIEAGKAVFDLHQLLNEELKIFEPETKEKQLALKLVLEEGICGTLKGNPIHLKRILHSLIGNAVKFTEQGKIMISVRQDESDKSDRHVRLWFCVQDTGIGVPADQVNAIFEPFFQADGSMTRNYEGIGLGLTLAKNLVELMGGTIEVTSTLGHGSTFCFSIVFDRI